MVFSIGLIVIKEVNLALSAIFNNIIHSTNHPALAIQGLITVVGAMAYYGYLIFDISAPASIISYVQVFMPTHIKGGGQTS